MVEARLSLADVNEVATGRRADVRLTSINRNERPILGGTIHTVSADRITDEKSGQAYYAIQVSLLGPDHPDVASSVTNLARLYVDLGRYADAEPLLKRALAIWEKALGSDHPDVALSLNNLAVLYSNQGRYVDAELLYKQALTIREKALGADHPQVAESLNNLAVLYSNQGRYFDALPLVQRTISVGFSKKPIAALRVLFGSRGESLIPPNQAFDDSLNVISTSFAVVRCRSPQQA